MKSKILTTMVLASSLAFLNCGDDTISSAINDYASGFSSSSTEVVHPADEGVSSSLRKPCSVTLIRKNNANEPPIL